MNPTVQSSGTLDDLGAKVKAKYPGQYDDLPDAEVGQRIQAKFPGQYDDFQGVKSSVPGMEKLGGVPPPGGRTGVTNLVTGEQPDHPYGPDPDLSNFAQKHPTLYGLAKGSFLGSAVPAPEALAVGDMPASTLPIAGRTIAKQAGNLAEDINILHPFQTLSRIPRAIRQGIADYKADVNTPGLERNFNQPTYAPQPTQNLQYTNPAKPVLGPRPQLTTPPSGAPASSGVPTTPPQEMPWLNRRPIPPPTPPGIGRTPLWQQPNAAPPSTVPDMPTLPSVRPEPPQIRSGAQSAPTAPAPTNGPTTPPLATGSVIHPNYAANQSGLATKIAQDLDSEGITSSHLDDLETREQPAQDLFWNNVGLRAAQKGLTPNKNYSPSSATIQQVKAILKTKGMGAGGQ
jgi:hypothetical protein